LFLFFCKKPCWFILSALFNLSIICFSASQVAYAQYGPLVESLLVEANRALSKKQLTTPSHDNAYDRFQSVLLLDPDNGQARAGLQAILISYSQFIRDDIRGSRYSSARKHLKRVMEYYPNNVLVADLKRELGQKERKYQAAKPSLKKAIVSSPESQEYTDIVISEKQLKAKNSVLVDKLAGIAQQLASTDETVLIYTRNDTDGRWVYKQLKKAAKGYRIRGDIRRGKPKLRILPPID